MRPRRGASQTAVSTLPAGSRGSPREGDVSSEHEERRSLERRETSSSSSSRFRDLHRLSSFGPRAPRFRTARKPRPSARATSNDASRREDLAEQTRARTRRMEAVLGAARRRRAPAPPPCGRSFSFTDVSRTRARARPRRHAREHVRIARRRARRARRAAGSGPGTPRSNAAVGEGERRAPRPRRARGGAPPRRRTCVTFRAAAVGRAPRGHRRSARAPPHRDDERAAARPRRRRRRLAQTRGSAGRFPAPVPTARALGTCLRPRSRTPRARAR